MPYSDINTATLLNEEALREHREEWEIEGEFDPESSFVQLRNEGLEPDPLEGQVFKARDLVRPLDSGADLFPTGVKVLDRLLQGGVARGEMIEALSAPGARTSGRFSLLLSMASMATRAGEQVALVDLGDHLDPQVAERAGVDLERLLWLRPKHMKQAVGSAELLITTGFPLVLLDLGTPPVPGGRGKEASWLRLARAAQAHRGALLVSSPYRASGTAATAVVEISRGRAAWWSSNHRQRSSSSKATVRGSSPYLLAGVYGAAHLEKGRARLKQHDVEASLLNGSFGLSLPSEALADPDLRTAAPPPRRRTQRLWNDQSSSNQSATDLESGTIRHSRPRLVASSESSLPNISPKPKRPKRFKREDL